MVLFSQTVTAPRRFKWDAKADPCPYFDNYAKFFATTDQERSAERFKRSNIPLDEKAIVWKKSEKPVAETNSTTWIAK